MTPEEHKSRLVNRVRFYHYISEVLVSQQADPICGICKALANSVIAMREDVAQFSSERGEDLRALPGGFTRLLEDARIRLETLRIPEDAAGQKKAGNCRMPEGVCFVKYSKALPGRL